MWKLYEVKLTVSIIKVLLEHSHIYCLLLPLLYFILNLFICLHQVLIVACRILNCGIWDLVP